MQGNEVVGRITPVGGLRKGTGAGSGPPPPAAFPKCIRLVEQARHEALRALSQRKSAC